MITVSQRLEGIGEYYFSRKLQEIDALNKAGKKVINLGIGSPDLPPHPEVIRVLQEASGRPDVHAYQSYRGSPVLRRAMSDWYWRWYGVSLDADREILPLIGSKEGIMHVCMTFLNPGDRVLVPNPGYPTYRSAVALAGGVAVDYVLDESKQWQPDWEALAGLEPKSVKLMFLNYPHMPTGARPDTGALRQLLAIAREKQFLVVHDNPYSFILNDKPMSLLSLPEAAGTVLELNSLSKSHNMAGWRIGMLCGDADRLNEVLRFKSNMDSGMFLPVQLAAARALELDEEWRLQLNSVYARRQQRVFELLRLLNCRFAEDQCGLFVWAAVPKKYENGFALSDEVLRQAAVFITPGGIFGSAGDHYVRVSLCSSEEHLEQACHRIVEAGLAVNEQTT